MYFLQRGGDLIPPHTRDVLQQPRVSTGWGGFIDGAIESGMEAALGATSHLGVRPATRGQALR